MEEQDLEQYILDEQKHDHEQEQESNHDVPTSVILDEKEP